MCLVREYELIDESFVVINKLIFPDAFDFNKERIVKQNILSSLSSLLLNLMDCLQQEVLYHLFRNDL